jgi:hypothetical protein
LRQLTPTLTAAALLILTAWPSPGVAQDLDPGSSDDGLELYFRRLSPKAATGQEGRRGKHVTGHHRRHAYGKYEHRRRPGRSQPE